MLLILKFLQRLLVLLKYGFGEDAEFYTAFKDFAHAADLVAAVSVLLDAAYVDLLVLTECHNRV